MERESAVREILQSIGPLFPEDAAKARAARKEALARALVPNEIAVPSMKTAPKPVLASQIDNADKTEVASLADVIARLSPTTPASVRDAVPELVRPAAPDVAALRAALELRDLEPEPTPLDVIEPVVAEAIPAFTELPAELAPEAPVEETLVEPEDVVFLEPSPSEIQAALAQAIEAQRDPAERAAAVSPEPVAPIPDVFSEDEQDAFVYAVADAILPARPYPPANLGKRDAPAASFEPTPAPAPVAEPVVTPAPVAEQPKPKFKRAKAKKDVEAAKPVEAKAPEATVAEAKAPEEKTPAAEAPAADPTPVQNEPVPALSMEDELIRQIRAHRKDLIDVDDQIARIDREIAAEQQSIADYVSMVEQKNMRHARLVRLRTSTQRFVETLQLKAEPARRPLRIEKKSA